MNNSVPPLIEETNLSRAWARAFLHIINNPGKEISPLLITLTGFNNGVPDENQAIRDALDDSLIANSKQKVQTVANTIFPASYWRVAKHNRHKFFDIYLKNIPRIKALAHSKNRRGIYFERLIAFGSCPENGNQLEYIISQYNSRPGVRRSMFQASVFDPARDHVSSAQLPFPCLQHLSFVPQGNSLTVNAFYATQQIYEKAYGNYLGLCRLGDFMAHEMGLTLGRMNCFVGVAKLDTIKKSHPSLTTLKNVAQNVLHITTEQQTAEGIKHGN